MGRALVQMIHDDGALELSGAIDSPKSPFLGLDAGELAGVGALGWPLTGHLEAL
ncbi:MAG: Dihydrodipicolinate reductase, N-terminus, partial [Myxococcaceae bacterium]|nr:Dihydrodipicolinate reductase, N-terminus [Myxococcaceae bacterium]